MSCLSNLKKVSLLISAVLFLGLSSCTETVYVRQNGTYYNDWEAVNHYRVTSANRSKKVKSQTKAPNWRKYNHKNKLKRYN